MSLSDFWKKFHRDPLKAVFKTTTLGGNPKANLAIAAGLLGAGFGLPALGGLLGGGGAAAAGIGEAAIGGAAAGAGGTLGGTAGMFGASPGFAGSLLAPSATPFFTGAAATPAIGGASMFGPTAAGAESLAALSGPGAGLGGGFSMGQGLEALNKIAKLQQLAGGQQQPQQAPAQRPQAQPNDDGMAYIRAIYELQKRYGGTA